MSSLCSAPVWLQPRTPPPLRPIREKYDVVTASTEVNVASGYKQNVIGFGWPNAAYEKMQALVKAANLPEEQILVPHRVCAAK